MNNIKFKKKLILLLLIALTTTIVVTKVNAFLRPPNPTMDYVPQNLGIYDTYYDNFQEPDCRVCHGASLAERHHGTPKALIGRCNFCHTDSTAPKPDMDCKLCHIDGGPIGDFGSPHHKSDFANSDQCNQCHFQVARTNTVEPPGHVPTSTTPTPYSCENCHWPSGGAPHVAATYPEGSPPGDDPISEFLTDWQSWTGSPKPTLTKGIEDPQPIEANGPLFNGTLGEKPYWPASGTHHKAGGKVFPKCYNCHASSPGTNPDWDPANPYLIRYCENCHTEGTLHNIKEHMTTNNIYTVGGLLNQTVRANEKCMACHGDVLPGDLQISVTVPLIDRLEPDYGPPGIVVSIIPASGQCWTEDPVDGLCSFGIKMIGDTVKIGQKGIQGDWYWVDTSIYSWSEHLIQIRVTGWPFQPGKTRVKIHKNMLGTSNSKVFNVRELPAIYSLTPSVGNGNQPVDINGAGFGIKQEKVYQNGYGYSSYVELSSFDKKYRATFYKDLDPSIPGKQWDQNKIKIRLENLLDIDTENPVLVEDLYDGCWNMRVITDYFRDNGDGKYFDSATGRLDTGDELLYRNVSNPACFRITKDPYINSISPNPLPYLEIATINGCNFGPLQDTSIVKVWNEKITKFKVAKIRYWSDTKINFVVPKFGTDPATYPKKKRVQVVVPGKPVGNYYKLTITSRGP